MEGYIMYKVKKKETFIPSSNGKDRLHVIVWEPQGEIRAILQISHGMIELIDRYDERSVAFILFKHRTHGGKYG